MSVLDKFKDQLTPEDFTTLEESVKELIEEKAKIRAEALVAEETVRIEDLADEFTEREIVTRLNEAVSKMEADFEEKTSKFKEAAVEKIEGFAEQYVSEQVESIVSAKLAALDEEYETAVKELEETVVSDLDTFLDMEISNNISNDLLEGIAINETFKPIVTGIKQLFESNFVALDTDSKVIVDAAEEKAKKLTSKLNEAYSSKMSLQEKIDELQTSLLIATRTDGLTATQKAKVKSMFEGKSYDEVAKKIGTFIEVLEEKEETLTEDKTVNDDIFLDEDKTVEDDKLEEDRKEAETTTIDEDYKIRLEKINQYL